MPPLPWMLSCQAVAIVSWRWFTALWHSKHWFVSPADGCGRGVGGGGPGMSEGAGVGVSKGTW